MTEKWVEAKGFPKYLVSSQGNIVVKDTGEEPKTRIQPGGKGRVTYQLRGPDGWKLVPLHRLVAASFFEDDISGYEINHADGDPSNNAVWNLIFTTTEENREHAYEQGLMHRPIRVENLDTGEIYGSINEAGRRLGYCSVLPLPKNVAATGEIFVKKGHRLRVVLD